MSNDSTIWISERAKELGFAMCGVVRAENFPELARSGEWLERGFAGEMKYLSDERRGDVQRGPAGRIGCDRVLKAEGGRRRVVSRGLCRALPHGVAAGH